MDVPDSRDIFGTRLPSVSSIAERPNPSKGSKRPCKTAHGAAKESNLPTLGLPGTAGFEGRRLQGYCAWLGAFLFGYVRLGGVRFAEFGTRLGTCSVARTPPSESPERLSG